MTRRWLLPCLLLAATAVVALQAFLPRGRSFLGIAPPELTTTEWIGGEGRHRLSDHRGSAVLLVFWQTSCGPCRSDMPDLQELADRHADEGLRVIGVTNESRETVLRFFAHEQRAPRYPIALGGAAAFEVTRVPHSYLIGPDGNVVWEGRSTSLPDEVLSTTLARTTELPQALREDCARARVGRAAVELAQGRTHAAIRYLRAVEDELSDTMAATAATFRLAQLTTPERELAWSKLEGLVGPGCVPAEPFEDDTAAERADALDAFATAAETRATDAAMYARYWAALLR